MGEGWGNSVDVGVEDVGCSYVNLMLDVSKNLKFREARGASSLAYFSEHKNAQLSGMCFG